MIDRRQGRGPVGRTMLPAGRTRADARKAMSVPYARRLVIMVKQPRLGSVKTRLASECGAVAATQFYRATSAAVLARLSATSRWQTWLAVMPDGATGSRCWPPQLARRPQGTGDLGRRMQRIMAWRGAGPIVIVGSDIPAISRSHIAAAFRVLGRNDAVFGPAEDGGYWLVGLRRSPKVASAFGDVRWSSTDALADTLANLTDGRVGFVDVLQDVDHAAALDRMRAWCGRRVLPWQVARR